MKKDRLARRLQLVRTTVRRLSTNELATVIGGGDAAAAAAAAIGIPTGGVPTTDPTICDLRFTRLNE